MTRLLPHRAHPVLTGADLEYVFSSYLHLEEIARRERLDPEQLAGWIEAGHLPRPAYLLPDGTPVFPPGLLDLRVRRHRGCQAPKAVMNRAGWQTRLVDLRAVGDCGIR